jgi:3-hydroxyacyl-CoA dehydrogenase/enoyl-CoA hydratase/3-hydroxybutyryl-CoA epimerase
MTTDTLASTPAATPATPPAIPPAGDATSAFRHWRLAREADGLAWLTLDQADASTNTFSAEVLAEFSRMLDLLAANPPRALVLRSGKASGFAAGADVAEFQRVTTVEEALPIVRRGWDAFERLAAVSYPTLALIHGFAMGGGLEVALACRYRIAIDDPKTRLSLPEVMLGILPGWGGVKRLPRVVGPSAALDMMLTGKSIDARRAKRMGLVDACVPERVQDNAVRGMLRELPPPRTLGWRDRLMAGPLRGVVAALARRNVARRARPDQYPAPYAIIDLWQRHDGDPFAAPPGGQSAIATLLGHPTTKNLIRVFGLQDRLKSLGKTSAFKATHVHVIGAGTMGGDIAAWCALRGCTVTLQDQEAARIAPAIERARKLFARRMRSDRLGARDALDRLVPDLAGDGIRRADVVIEAIVENLAIKQELFARIEPQTKPGALLATNTSSLQLADVAARMRDPSRLVGLHFFNPVARMMLVEIVASAGTDPARAQDAAAFARQIDKLPLPVQDAPGFLVNRVLGPYLANAIRLVDQGTAPETIDAAATWFGMPMGPIELADVVGLDICAAAGRALAGRDAPASPRLEALVAAKKLGKKTGEGFYRWVNDRPVKAKAAAFDPQLVQALIRPYVAEAWKAVDEGIVADADLADAGLIFGTGFAPYTGGPLHAHPRDRAGTASPA